MFSKHLKTSALTQLQSETLQFHNNNAFTWFMTAFNEYIIGLILLNLKYL